MTRSTRRLKTARRAGYTRRRSGAPLMTRGALKRLGVVALWSATFVGAAYGLHRLEPYARSAEGNGPWKLQWVDLPPALDEWILEEVEQQTGVYDLTATLAADGSDINLCARLGNKLARSPWVANVNRVSKHADRVVRVHATFREYLTFVVRDGMGYLVDAEGVRLPRQEPAAYTEPYGMILVTGVRGPVPQLGQAWSGDDVAAGLRLVTFLTEHAPDGLRGLFKAVDVSNYQNRINSRDGWLRIRTAYPGRSILWGLPPGAEYDIECTAQRKLELLWAHYAEHGQLPECAKIDVRNDDAILCLDAP